MPWFSSESWFQFGQSSPAPVSFSACSYGTHQRWVPPQTSSQVQYPRAGGAGLSPIHTSPSTSSSPRAVPKEPQGLRRYQTRMGPRAPSPVPQRRSRRARPSKRARTSGPGESSSSRPEPTPSPAAEATSSPQLSPASRIRRPLFVGHPIPGNVRLHSRDFHGESYYDVPELMDDHRFRDSMRLIEHYSFLPFMTPRQFYYPRLVLQFYHSMTYRGAPSPLELRFSIDDRPRVLRAADISAALGLQAVQANVGGYRDWPQPTQREMVRSLARDTTSGPVLFRRQLPPQMLLIDHLLRTSLFSFQHYVQRGGAILEALYRISEGFWFSPSELVMTALLHFEDKVHRKGLARAESIPLLMPRLLCQVLEHLGFPEEPRIERRFRCPQVLSMEQAMVMPISFLLQQQDQEEVPDQEAEDSHRTDSHAPDPEVQRSPVLDMSPPSPPLPTSSVASADTPGPSYTAQHSSEYVHASTREIAGVMDVVCSLVATQAAKDQRLARAEATLEDFHSMLQQIMSHLGLPHVPAQRDEPAAAAVASLDMLAAAAAATNPPPPQE